MEVLVGGESKVGSTEDEGISGGPGLDMTSVDRAMLSHRLGRRWQLSAVCMALHDAYKGSPYFHRVVQSAGVILPYRNDHNIAKDFVALCKLVLNNLCPLSCYQNHVDRLGRVRNLRWTIYCSENGFVVHIRQYKMSVIRGIYYRSS
jgi:hypothetical protein